MNRDDCRAISLEHFGRLIAAAAIVKWALNAPSIISSREPREKKWPEPIGSGRGEIATMEMQA